MEEKIKLKLLGITYNQIESGVYAVILEEESGQRRLPIIIGSAEAQSIECRLQDIVTPRPLTHDLFASMMRAFHLTLQEVILRRLPSGIFAADLVMSDGNETITIDSRSSDAIGIAIRTGSPIYTTESVMAEAGFSADQGVKPEPSQGAPSQQRRPSNPLASMSDKDLEKAMAKAVEVEDYEEASRIKKELDRRRGE